jgi:FAD/FMN-containing dehydrogenase
MPARQPGALHPRRQRGGKRRGLRGLKYGVTRDYVMCLQFFDLNSETIKTGSRTVKCATGYNLARLLVGSEGTLGVFDQITLKLIPLPAGQRAMTAVFDQAERASETVSAIIAGHSVPATLEFMDNFTIWAVEDFSLDDRGWKAARKPANKHSTYLEDGKGEPPLPYIFLQGSRCLLRTSARAR